VNLAGTLLPVPSLAVTMSERRDDALRRQSLSLRSSAQSTGSRPPRSIPRVAQASPCRQAKACCSSRPMRFGRYGCRSGTAPPVHDGCLKNERLRGSVPRDLFSREPPLSEGMEGNSEGENRNPFSRSAAITIALSNVLISDYLSNRTDSQWVQRSLLRQARPPSRFYDAALTSRTCLQLPRQRKPSQVHAR
jgi:hypothetical protein